MRVFTALLMHESSSFSPLPTTLASYAGSLLYLPGEDRWNEMAETLDGHADFVRLAAAAGHTVIRGLMADTAPGMPSPYDVYVSLRDRILKQIAAALPLDMILLTLHGAQMAEDCEDCEGDLLERIRGLVGCDVVVAVEFDLHFNLSARQVANATLINSCMEYPHTDVADRAERLYHLAERAKRGEISPVMAWAPVPILGQFFTTRQPMRDLVDKAVAMEALPGVLSISLGHGFPHADAERTGASVLVVCDGDFALAKRLAGQLAAEFFALREEIVAPQVSLEQMIESVRHMRDAPLIVADGADNPGGGAPCDSTFILQALLDAGVSGAVVAWICDAESALTAAKAGVGEDVALSIGGKHGPVSGPPVNVVARVLNVVSGFRQVGLGCCADTELGVAAVVCVRGVEIVLVSVRNQHYGPDSLLDLGIDVLRRQVVVVKSSQHFHTRYAPLAAQIIYVDTPGALTLRFAELSYRRLKRPIWPIWPLDDIHVPAADTVESYGGKWE